MNKEMSVIVPAYNEEDAIVSTIKKLRIELPDAEIIIVDDYSKDATCKLAKNQGVRVIRHTKNKGYGGALKTGFKAAKTKYISFLDADLTYLPKYLKLFLKRLKDRKLDVVWGNRFGGSKNDMPLVRKIGNRILATLFMLMTGRYVPDTACGERVFTKKGLAMIDYETLPDGLDMITAMTKRIVARRLKYEIIGMDYHMRGGQSKLNIIKDFIRMARNIVIEK